MLYYTVVVSSSSSNNSAIDLYTENVYGLEHKQRNVTIIL